MICRISLIIFLAIIGKGCKEKENIPTYYVEYNVYNKNLDSVLNLYTSGKILYYDETHNLKIIPESYKISDYDGMRRLRLILDTPTIILPNTIKYTVSVSDSLFTDSTFINILKYVRRNNKWEMRSDMSHIKATTTEARGWRGKYFKHPELAEQIINIISLDTFIE